jgi:hypothetical protein
MTWCWSHQIWPQAQGLPCSSMQDQSQRQGEMYGVAGSTWQQPEGNSKGASEGWGPCPCLWAPGWTDFTSATGGGGLGAFSHVCPGCAGVHWQGRRSGGRLPLTRSICKLKTEGLHYRFIYMWRGPEGSGACIYRMMHNSRQGTYKRGVLQGPEIYRCVGVMIDQS